MATKDCPFCAEEIQVEAVKCKHCGSWLDGRPNPTGTGPPPLPKADPYAGAGYAPTRRLVRPVGDRMMAGVCAGLGRYVGMETTLLRVLYAIATFFTGIVPGIVLYVVLAFVVPSEDDPRALM